MIMKKDIIKGELFDYEILEDEQGLKIMGGVLEKCEDFENQYRLTFVNTQFEECDFTGLSETHKTNGKIIYLSFKNCSFYNCRFDDSTYGALLLIHCDFHNCSLNNVWIDLSTLRKIEFYHCKLNITIHDSIVAEWVKIHYCEDAKINIENKSVLKAHIDFMYSRIEMGVNGESALCSSVVDKSNISHCTIIFTLYNSTIVDGFEISYSTIYIENMKGLELIRADITASLSEVNIREKEDIESVRKFCEILKLDKSDLIKEV